MSVAFGWTQWYRKKLVADVVVGQSHSCPSLSAMGTREPEAYNRPEGLPRMVQLNWSDIVALMRFSGNHGKYLCILTGFVPISETSGDTESSGEDSGGDSESSEEDPGYRYLRGGESVETCRWELVSSFTAVMDAMREMHRGAWLSDFVVLHLLIAGPRVVYEGTVCSSDQLADLDLADRLYGTGRAMTCLSDIDMIDDSHDESDNSCS